MRGRALRAPVFLSSFPPPNGALRAPPPRTSQLRCFLFDPQKYIKSPAPLPAHRSFADPSGNIFWGQKYIPVRPYALIFFVFFSLVFGSYSLLFLLSFSISSYSSLLISSYYSRRAILRLLILLLLYFKLFVVLQTCILIICICTHIRHSEGFSEGAKPFLSSYSSLLYYIIFFIFLFFSSYNLTVYCITDLHMKHTLSKGT